MALTAGRAFVELIVKGKEKVSAELKEVESRLKKFGSMIGKMGMLVAKGIAAGGAAGFAALAAGLAIATKKASDMQETMNKLNVAFGSNAEQITQWADGTAKSFGRSKAEVRTFVSDFKAFLNPLKMTEEQSTEMSKALTRLSYDMASLGNTTDADAMNDLRSAMAGSGEVLQKYGVQLNEATIKQELMNKGIDPKNATQAQKAMARYNLILQGTKDAHGDVARSATSFANQQKTLKAQVDDVFVAIGERLLPTLERWMTDLSAAISLLMGQSDAGGAAADSLDGITGALDAMGGPIEIALRGWFGLKGIFDLLVAAGAKVASMLAQLTAMVADNPAVDFLMGDSASGLKNFAAQAAAVSQTLDKMAEDTFVNAGENFNKAFGSELSAALERERQKIKDQISQAETDYKEIASFGDDVKQAVEPAADKIKEASDKMVDAASPDSLESTSVAAYQRFNENRLNEQNRLLGKIYQELAKASIVLGEA